MGVVVVQSFSYIDPSDIRFSLPAVYASADHAQSILIEPNESSFIQDVKISEGYIGNFYLSPVSIEATWQDPEILKMKERSMNYSYDVFTEVSVGQVVRDTEFAAYVVAVDPVIVYSVDWYSMAEPAYWSELEVMGTRNYTLHHTEISNTNFFTANVKLVAMQNTSNAEPVVQVSQKLLMPKAVAEHDTIESIIGNLKAVTSRVECDPTMDTPNA